VVGGEAAGAGSEAASLVATRQDASAYTSHGLPGRVAECRRAGAVLLFEVAASAPCRTGFQLVHEGQANSLTYIMGGCFENPFDHLFFKPRLAGERSPLQQAAQFRLAAVQAFQSAGYEVQTTRLATPPFPTLLKDGGLDELSALAQALESQTAQAGFAYLSLVPPWWNSPQVMLAFRRQLPRRKMCSSLAP